MTESIPCPYCGTAAIAFSREPHSVIREAGLRVESEHVNPGGRRLGFDNGQVVQLMDMCPHCDAEKLRRELFTDGKESTVSIVDEIRDERRRQVEPEGWSPEHDDEHDTGELADAAAAYAMTDMNREVPFQPSGTPPKFWPFEARWWKPGDRRRELIKAGALIVAEIERIDRNGGNE